MVHYLGMSKTAADILLSGLHRHLPATITDLGRPYVFSQDMLLAIDNEGRWSVLGLDDHGNEAWRHVTVEPGLVELTCWRDGVETKRKLFNVDEDGQPEG